MRKQTSKPVVLYTVTTIGKIAGKQHDRTPAVCTTLARAKRMLELNEGDLYEAGYYPLAVIEMKPADIVYPQVQNACSKVRTQWWYRFDKTKRGYLPCRRPVRFKAVIGFGVG